MWKSIRYCAIGELKFSFEVTKSRIHLRNLGKWISCTAAGSSSYSALSLLLLQVIEYLCISFHLVTSRNVIQIVVNFLVFVNVTQKDRETKRTIFGQNNTTRTQLSILGFVLWLNRNNLWAFPSPCKTKVFVDYIGCVVFLLLFGGWLYGTTACLRFVFVYHIA